MKLEAMKLESEDAPEVAVKLEPESEGWVKKGASRVVRGRRYGSARKPRRARSASAEGLMTPLRLGRSRDRLPTAQGRPVLGGPDRARKLEELKTTYILNKLAHGTKLGYQKGVGTVAAVPVAAEEAAVPRRAHAGRAAPRRG